MDKGYIMILAATAVFLAVILLRAGIGRFLRQRNYREMMRAKGTEGEEDTAYYLSRVKGYKKILHNVYIPRASEPDAGVTEVDLIMVHKKGIFVVENKNYNGRIYGSEDDSRWTLISANGKKHAFYNPIRQNQSHIRCLKSLLEKSIEEEIPYYNVVTFNSQARLKHLSVYSGDVLVMNSIKAGRTIGKCLRFQKKVFKRSAVNEISSILKEYTQVSKKEQKEHLKYVTKKRYF